VRFVDAERNNLERFSAADGLPARHFDQARLLPLGVGG
jgi:hypothetical protein